MIHAFELLTHADGPCHWRTGNIQDGFDFVHHLNRVTGFAVHFVNEREDRRSTQTTHFHQFNGTVLDTFSSVHHHQRGINCSQRTIGVFREIFVPGGIQQVNDAALVRELHHRCCHGDTALLLHLHPVGGSVARLALAFYRASNLDRVTEQQQLLGQRGLTGIGVRNDSKCPANTCFTGTFAIILI